jgi:hypothetical protein
MFKSIQILPSYLAFKIINHCNSPVICELLQRLQIPHDLVYFSFSPKVFRRVRVIVVLLLIKLPDLCPML